ncbi:MAG TPA: hypothetical protein VIK40_03895, partial [Geomonas sp.]
MQLKQLQGGCLLVLALGISACGTGGGGGVTITPVQGKVSQGPVQGATIFADRLNSGTRSVMDGDEVNATTKATGIYDIGVPSNYGDYLLVSQGGTDTITGKAAMQMMAPPGAANVTPLTTMVALVPADQQLAVKALIQASGISFDADISTNATPAALFLAKSIETAIETLGKTIDPSGTLLTGAQLCDVQQKALSAIAATVASQPNLLTTATLQAAISTGITNAIPAIVAGNDGVTVNSADIATIATAVSNTVTTVATSMGSATGTFGTTTTVTEALQFPPATQSAIDTAVTANAGTAATVVIVHPVV